jgi:hypothetical protein
LNKAVTNAVVALAYETATAGFGALVFCSSRTGREANAAIISEVMPLESEVPEAVREARREVMSDLRNLSARYDIQFKKTVIRGVGFHRKPWIAVNEYSADFHSDAGLTIEGKRDNRKSL